MPRKLLLEGLRVTPRGMSFDIKSANIQTTETHFEGSFPTQILTVMPIVHILGPGENDIESNRFFGQNDVPADMFESWLTGSGENDWPQIWDRVVADFPNVEAELANRAKEAERQTRLEARRAKAAAKAAANVTPIKGAPRKPRRK